MTHTLLLEIGMEECPARFIPEAVAQLADETENLLRIARLDPSGIQTYATPRRLAVVVSRLNQYQQEMTEEIKGPPSRVAFDQEGKPTPAAQGFARNQGVKVEDLLVKSTEQGEYVFAYKHLTKQSAYDVLPSLLPELLGKLSFPKSMRWGEVETRFVRPVRWIVAMLDEKVIPFSFAGVNSGNKSRGHRYLSEGEIEIDVASNYEATLRSAHVIVNLNTRKQMILDQIHLEAKNYGVKLWPDEELLYEINLIVEHPFALVGTYDEEYLKLPMEVLTTTMKNHQRYFPLLSNRDQNQLVNRFIGVRDGDDYNVDVVRKGYEKVLQARLADATFFFEEDKKVTSEQRCFKLKNLQFQERLGSMWDKVERIVNLTQYIGKALSIEEDLQNKACRGASLCKSDLVTHMVYEFPELQGRMGRIYALTEGEDPLVAQAIDEHYAPRYSGAELPQSIPGALVSIADKVDTLCGCFAVGLIPSGSQDPYALRRQTIGILQILYAFKWGLNLSQIIEFGLGQYQDQIPEAIESKNTLMEFIKGRLRGILSEDGYSPDYLDAVLEGGLTTIPAVLDRLAALKWSGEQGILTTLLHIFDRVYNLSKSTDSCVVKESLLHQPEEIALWDVFKKVRDQFDQYLLRAEYKGALRALAGLESVVDEFFDGVLVMDKDEMVKQNRLALLKCIADTFCQVADLKRITTV